MVSYLLDTNILIDLCGGKRGKSFFQKILKGEEARIATSILCIAEFMAGAGRFEEKFLRHWIDSGELEIVYFDQLEDAYLAAKLRKENHLTLPDALILSCAIREKMHLLTYDADLLRNARHFISTSSP
ncbi:MAG: PIN domain-containing protein [Deltaproteobacteria bacterium]|nr:PIN domain-containing protein [Deltaproteobacteria bacterium]